MTKFEEEIDKMLRNDSSNIYREDLINHFKDWQPPQKKVKIPKFVAAYIEDRKKCVDIFHYAMQQDTQIAFITKEDLVDWILLHDEAFARAWFDGYEIEKPKKQVYVVPLSKSGKQYLEKDGSISVYFYGVEADKMTESEIKAIDERYWPFAVPMEGESK